MSTPQSNNNFLAALDAEIADAETKNERRTDYSEGYLEGLKWVYEYFHGPYNPTAEIV